jgi:uncharacterized protein YecE (DUF72 family)
MRQSILIGTSGFSYPHWKEVFYPSNLKPAHWLSYYSQFFNTVELNTTFYRLPTEATVKQWVAETPPEFLFAIKASRFITHVQKLKEPAQTITNFLDRLSPLSQKLRPILFQLSPSLSYSPALIDHFLEVLRTQPLIPSLKVTFEVRHPSWLVPQVFKQLKQENIALCFTDLSMLPISEPLTADFVYIRRHGPTLQYGSNYAPEMLEADAQRITEWNHSGREIYLYFNNDAQGHAVQNALQLKEFIESQQRENRLHPFRIQDSSDL